MKQLTKTQCRQWIDNLRSGKYEQGQGALKSVYCRYCCIGVLGEQLNLLGRLTDLETEYLIEEVDDNSSIERSIIGASESGRNWEEVLANLNDGCVAQHVDSFTKKLAIHKEEVVENGLTYSRVGPHSFAEIADIIEQHVLPDCLEG